MSDRRPNAPKPVRLGAVSFLNARPLVEGLNAKPNVAVTHAVPSRLPHMLDEGTVDVALIPTIDLARRQRGWNVVSDACIACDGATLTVRVFTRVDPADITTLHVDGDSHTSVALASIIWREKFGRRPGLVTLKKERLATSDGLAPTDGVLLIGDKVIAPPPGIERFSTHIDLGAAWKSLTGSPFVFAVWAASRLDDGARIAPILESARDAGVAAAADIAARYGPAAGWPVHLARTYLTENLTYTLGTAQRAGMQTFFELARRHQVSPPEPEPSFA